MSEEAELERLYSHHSECKEEMAHLVELAQLWRVRFEVVKRLLFYLNKLNPFWHEEDLEIEIKTQADLDLNEWKEEQLNVTGR